MLRHSIIRVLQISLLIQIIVGQTEQTFDQFKHQMEQKVTQMKKQMEFQYSYLCKAQTKQCEIKSYNECLATSLRKCYLDFPQRLDRSRNGARLGEQIGIIFPPGKNQDNINQQDRQFIMSSAKDLLKSFDDGRNEHYATSYIGSAEGFSRRYPSKKSSCGAFDPRERPWYVVGSTGRKNVMIIMDSSESMSKGKPKRIQMAKQATKRVIQTLSNSDFFGVITFSSHSSRLGYSRMMRATSQAKQKVKMKLDSVETDETDSNVSYITGFEAAENMVKQSLQHEQNCQNVTENIVLLITSNLHNNNEPADKLYALLDDINSTKPLKLFVYVLTDGETANTTLWKEMTCRYRGVMFKINDTSTLPETMADYHKYISSAITVDSPVWTEPYNDAFGFGQMVTVSYPVYYKKPGSDHQFIVGVAAIDVPMDSLERFNMMEEEIIERLLGQCPGNNINFSDCQLESLRPEESRCQRNCGSISNEQKCYGFNSQAYPKPIFYDIINADEDLCCPEMEREDVSNTNSTEIGRKSSSVSSLISAIITGGIILGALLVMVVAICYAKIRKNNINENASPQPENPDSKHFKRCCNQSEPIAKERKQAGLEIQEDGTENKSKSA